MIKLISKFALFILIAALLFLLISGNLLSSSPFVITGQILAIALSAWARRSFKDKQFSIHAQPVGGALLISGPYRFIRHPMYAAALLFLWSSVLGHLSSLTLGIGLIVTLVVAVRISVEEKFLKASYPNHADYAQNTKRVLPFIF